MICGIVLEGCPEANLNVSFKELVNRLLRMVLARRDAMARKIPANKHFVNCWFQNFLHGFFRVKVRMP